MSSLLADDATALALVEIRRDYNLATAAEIRTAIARARVLRIRGHYVLFVLCVRLPR